MEKEIIKKAVELLKSMESGEYISIWDLVEETKLADKDFMNEMSNMMDITRQIIKTAKEDGLYLESVLGEDAIVGLPYNIPYAIKRKYNPETIQKENCISVYYRAGGYMCCTPALEAEIQKDKSSAQVWDELMSVLYERAKVQNWYDQYTEYGILDGSYWTLELRFKDGFVAKYDGSNKEPRGLRSIEKTLCGNVIFPED